jgi:lysophospholipase L1-like esterase
MTTKITFKGLVSAAFVAVGLSLSVPQAAAAPTLYIAGDSTVQTYRASAAPQQGWGGRIPDYFTSGVTWVNKAIAGRSSKSFVNDGRLDEILAVIQPGDYFFIQFGHNDASSVPERHTDPFTTFKTYLAMYVDGARAHGATPVLVTPMGRRSFTNSTETVFKNDFPDYCTAMKQLAEEKNCKIIDLNTLSIAYYNSIGAAASKGVFLWLPAGVYPAFPTGASDSTHFQEFGANQIARIMTNGILAIDLPIKTSIKGYAGGTYPAEFAVVTGGVYETTSAGFNNSGYVNLGATGAVVFNNVNGNGGGAKRLAIRYANGFTTARTGSLTINGSTTNITFPVTGAWTTWQTLTVNITLNASLTNVIKLASTGNDLANIDEVTVLPGTTTGVTLQAESAVLGGGTVFEAANTGFNGTGYANSSLSGGTITFNNIPGNGGGTKNLAIRFANGGGAARTGNLIVNGTTTSISFQPTGAWTTWQTLNVNIVLNNNSTNSIQLATTGTDLGNIDEITIP